jgi:iron(III) transport system substrate-binding protein
MKSRILIVSSILLAVPTLLTSCSSKEQVLIYTTTEEERNVFIQKELNEKFPNYNVVVQYMGTGSLFTKLSSEGTSTDCDIFYELETCSAESLLASNANLFASLDDYDFSIYDSSVTGYLAKHKKYAINSKLNTGVLYNKKVLTANGLSIPTKYSDLLDSKYKGLVETSNPKSSGTGYSIYNGLASADGLDNALTYFGSLSTNIKEFTSSGSAPIKAVDRGDVAVGFGMLWQCVEYSNNNSDLGFTFLDKGSAYNLYSSGMIGGHEKRSAVKEVFDYFYNTINKEQTQSFVPDKIYKDQAAPTIANYPTNVTEVTMQGLFDPAYKANLIDKWTF